MRFRLPARAGFTAIELVLSVGIISLMLAISTPIMQRFLLQNDTEVATNVLVQDLYRAQSLARNSERDNTWGVHVQTGQITLFEGTSYANRNAASDETYPIASAIAISGQTDYVFSKLTAVPTTVGSTTFTANNASRTVTVSAKGMVEY